MSNVKKLNSYGKTIIAVYIGDNIIDLLPKSEGYFFCKEKLSLCRNWIEGFEVDLEDYADCLDNSCEKDLVYYTSNEKDKDCQEIYGMILQIVSYTAAQAITEGGLSLPEYLEDIDDKYLYSLIDVSIGKYKDMEGKVSLVIEYCKDRILQR